MKRWAGIATVLAVSAGVKADTNGIDDVFTRSIDASGGPVA